MAVTATTEWEVRTDGDKYNGGGFDDLDPGTSVDYSQQAAAQLAITDLTSDATGVIISSATGGFTPAMVGNCICITVSGSFGILGWHQITGYTSTNTVTIDRSAGTNDTGGVANVGGAYTFDTSTDGSFWGTSSLQAFNTTHIKAGTYDLSSHSLLNIFRGSLRFYGYNTTRLDDPEGDNRPLLDFDTGSGRVVLSGVSSWYKNLRVTSAYTGSNSMANLGAVLGLLRNAKFTQTAGSGGDALDVTGAGARCIHVEASHTNGNAIMVAGESNIFTFCYVHDSGYGFNYTSTPEYSVISDCIVDTCSAHGIRGYGGLRVLDTTVYNCVTGIEVITSGGLLAFNNIVHTCTTGIKSTSTSDIEDHNCVYNCGTPWDTIIQGDNSITDNPLLGDPANQDFSLSSGSPCFNTGAKLGTIVGLP